VYFMRSMRSLPASYRDRIDRNQVMTGPETPRQLRRARSKH
jgi:hypothetical protein